MDMITLKATIRDPKSKPNALRQQGQVPAVVYGTTEKNMHIQCLEKDLHKTFIKAGESTLVELDIDGKKVPVLFKDISFHPVSDREIHADFYAVNMKEEIETLVPIHFEGESPAVKELSAIFVINNDSVTVRCLPSDLPHSLTVNISTLAAFHDSVSVKDIQLPKGVQVKDDEATVLASVQEPRKEEEVTPATTDAAAAAPGADGAAAPAEGAAAAPADAKAGGKDKK